MPHKEMKDLPKPNTHSNVGGHMGKHVEKRTLPKLPGKRQANAANKCGQMGRGDIVNTSHSRK